MSARAAGLEPAASRFVRVIGSTKSESLPTSTKFLHVFSKASSIILTAVYRLLRRGAVSETVALLRTQS